MYHLKFQSTHLLIEVNFLFDVRIVANGVKKWKKEGEPTNNTEVHSK